MPVLYMWEDNPSCGLLLATPQQHQLSIMVGFRHREGGAIGKLGVRLLLNAGTEGSCGCSSYAGRDRIG